MLIKIGRNFELEIQVGLLFFRLPYVGQGCWVRGEPEGLVFDRWSKLKANKQENSELLQDGETDLISVA